MGRSPTCSVARLPSRQRPWLWRSIPRDWIEQIQYPAPDDYPDVGAWLDAFFAAESERGPHVDADPSINYGSVWALWLSAVPYGLWSEEIRGPSMEEHTQWLRSWTRYC